MITKDRSTQVFRFGAFVARGTAQEWCKGAFAGPTIPGEKLSLTIPGTAGMDNFNPSSSGSRSQI